MKPLFMARAGLALAATALGAQKLGSETTFPMTYEMSSAKGEAVVRRVGQSGNLIASISTMAAPTAAIVHRRGLSMRFLSAFQWAAVTVIASMWPHSASTISSRGPCHRRSEYGVADTALCVRYQR